MALTGSTGWVLPVSCSNYLVSGFTTTGPSQSQMDNLLVDDTNACYIGVATSQRAGRVKTRYNFNVPPGAIITGLQGQMYGQQDQFASGGGTYFRVSVNVSNTNSSATFGGTTLSKSGALGNYYANWGTEYYTMSAANVATHLTPEVVNDPLFGLSFYTDHTSGWDGRFRYQKLKIDYELPDMVTTVGMMG